MAAKVMPRNAQVHNKGNNILAILEPGCKTEGIQIVLVMKVKTITRCTTTHTRERSTDHFTARHNPSPDLHPFERAREYKRALNAVKLERLFAKPFVMALDGHIEGVYSVEAHPKDLKYAVSASADGELRVWNVSVGGCALKVERAHSGFCRAVSFSPDADRLDFVSGGDDKSVKIWSIPKTDSELSYVVEEIVTDHPILSIDHVCEAGKAVFATAGETVNVYKYGRKDPIRTLRATGHDSLQAVRFNRAEPDLLAATCSDRSILLYDLRAHNEAPISKTTLKMRSNALSWNPLEPMYFAVANEDHNGYIFDMRMMANRAVNVLTGALGALMDIQYSPTGLQIATASYDRAVRLYDTQHGTPRDTYTNRRMQRCTTLSYTADSHYLLTGSDEGVVRLWRTRSDRRPAPLLSREHSALHYQDALKQRFQHAPEIKRISQHRHLPGWMKKEARKERVHEASVRRKEENVAWHGKVEVKRGTLRDVVEKDDN